MSGLYINQSVIDRRKKEKLAEKEIEELKQQLESERNEKIELKQEVDDLKSQALEIQSYMVDQQYNELLNQGGM